MLLHFLWWVSGAVKGTVESVNVVQHVAVMWETGMLHNDTEAPRWCGCITADCLHQK